MKRHIIWLLGLAAGGLLAAGLALSQTGTTFVITPTGNELVAVAPFGTGMNQSVYLTQIRDGQGYAKVQPVTTNVVAQVGTAGANVTYPANISRLILQPAGTLAALTVTMPGPTVPGVSGPVDGSELCIFSTQILTSLTMNVVSGSGQTLNGGLSTIAAANAPGVCWAYTLSTKTWDRSE